MEKILLVEDNENIMMINATYLTRLGYTIEQAYTVRQAEEKFESFRPDMIVLDVMLPDGDGMDFCRKLRKKSGTPVLFLTAKVTERDIINGLEIGGDEYLTKPYDLNVFGAKVKALLRRTRSVLPQNQSFTIGLLHLDIVQSQAYAGEENLKLSRTEFGILLYLAQHQGRIVPRSELYNAVWGLSDEENGTMLWTAISRLKHKLHSFEADFYIDSDHNGYELIVHNDSEGRWRL